MATVTRSRDRPAELSSRRASSGQAEILPPYYGQDVVIDPPWSQAFPLSLAIDAHVSPSKVAYML